MKKHKRLLSIILAMLLIIGSIAISGIAFGEEEDFLESEPYSVVPQSSDNYDGSIILHKRVDENSGFDKDEVFKFILRGVDNDYYKEQSLSKNELQGNHVAFRGLAYGDYTLEEVLDKEKYESYYVSYGPDKERIEGSFKVDGPGVQIWVMNTSKKNTPEEPWMGTIRVLKTFVDETGEEIEPVNVSFTLVGPDYNETKSIENGEVEFLELKKGEYTLTENTPEGYTSSIPNGKSIDLPEDAYANHEYTIEVINTKIPDDTPPPELPKGKVAVRKIVQNRFGDVIEVNNPRFHFNLYVLEGDTWTLKDSDYIDGNGTVEFDKLEDGKYRIREVNIDGDFRLISDNNQEITIIRGSSEEVEFTNRRLPSTPTDPDPKPDPKPDKPEKPDKPKEEPKVDGKIEVVPQEPVPEAQPEPPTPEPEVEEIEVVVEPVPEAKPTLPKTGTASPFMYTGLGTVLLGLGVYLKKKKEE